jgi:glycosyltransferase involved in cell wall biosynthesis
MGGAERLMIETTRHLVCKYHFVIVNTEPLPAESGSLHADALRTAEVYDLAETVRQEDRLVAIELLKAYYEPALVWITNGSPWQIAHARQLREIFRDTPIVDNQAYDHEHGWINSFADSDVRSADRYIAVNERIRNAMVERFGIGTQHIDLVYHGANIAHLRSDLSGSDRAQRRSALGLPANGMVFGMIGRLTPQKRPQDLVHLASRVLASGSNHHFLWAGPGELRAEIDSLRRELKAENFSLLEARADVRPLYEAMDGLIVTSEFEGLPLVVLEALAMGVPVLSTPVGAIPEVLHRFGSGQITGVPGDLLALQVAFEKFLQDLPSLRAIAMARRFEVIDAYCSDRMAAEYDASWQCAIENRRTRAQSPRSGTRISLSESAEGLAAAAGNTRLCETDS